MTLRKALNVAAAIVGLILLMLLHDASSDFLSGTQQSIALVVILVVVLLMLWGGPDISFDSGSFVMQAITGVALLLLLDFVLYQMNPTSALFNTPEGWGHLALYFVIIFVASMVGANYSGFKFLAGMAIIIFIFSAVGFRTKQLYDPDGRVWARVTHGIFASRPSSVHYSACASRAPEGAEILTRWDNPGRCDLAYTISVGCVMFYYNRGPSQQVCAGQTLKPAAYVITTRAEALGYAEWFHRKCDEGTWVIGTWQCRRRT